MPDRLAYMRSAHPTVALSLRRAGLAVLAVAALLMTGLSAAAAVAPAAPTPGGTFASSFESGDPQVQVGAPFGPQINVSGVIPPGSVNASVAAVRASKENPTGEVATNLLDGNPGTKWLAFDATAWISYQFSSPVVATGYALTSAGDAPERDPKNWTLSVSDDGSTWISIDEKSNQVFTGRGQLRTFATANTTAHRFYRLNITQNNGGPITQLADWDLRDGRTGVSPMLATVLGGPNNGLNTKPGVGFSGLHALRFGGSHPADGPASATDLLYGGVQQRLAASSELSYLLFPDDSKDLARPSTFVALDLVLDDGSRLSTRTPLVDANGFGITARAHGQQKALFANQWNSVHIDLGALAGRTVEKILLTYDFPGGHAGTVFSGWLDDVRIGAAAPAVNGQSRVNYVDTRRGTLSNDKLSRGTNIPATAMPNGFNFFTPMTNAGGSNLEYEYQRANNAENHPTLQAIGISHEPSIWMGDRDRLAVMPSTDATPKGDPTARAVPFTHANEVARPDLYQVKLDNAMTAAITPTDHGGIYRFTFPGSTGSVILDKVSQSASLHIAADGTVTGWVEGGDGAGITRMFVYGTFDTAPTAVGTTSDRGSAQYASFAVQPGTAVQLRLATSFLSLAQAQHNLNLEVTGRSFEQVDRAATAAWNSRLGVLDVQGATANQLVTLYSSLYRMNLYPNSQFENTGTAAAPKYQHASPVAPTTGAATDTTTTNAAVFNGELYVNNGFWDTYRTVWPLYSLLYPDIAAKLVNGFTQQYREAGWIARWSSPGYANLMTGTSSDAAFATAYIDGALPTATALDAYDAALKNATVLPPGDAVGRKALDQSIFLGYTPDTQGESVSWGMEGYINDHAIGLMAAKLANDGQTPRSRRSQLQEESTYFLDRAQNYVQMFDPATGFFRPKTAAGGVPGGATYDPTAWWGPYTETDGWNFAFHAPQDVPGLESLYGGSAGLVNKLDQFFATPETGGNGDIHEMVEARAVRMGQLGMSNQPSHHIPYLYAAAGVPSKTQAVVREIQQRLFVGSDIGQGYLGDEDNGEMSSWYIFSALGFYPLSPASGQYTIGSPLFTKSTIHLAGGRDLVIDAPNNSNDHQYVRSAQLDGHRLTTAAVSQADLARGGHLTFDMSATPTGWAQQPTPAHTPTPSVDATKAGYGHVSSSDGSNITALTDDNSRTVTTFATTDPTLTWTSTSGSVTVNTYTLTSGPTGAAPTGWHLQGSRNGQPWKTLDARTDQKFAWATQTRPFVIKQPGRYDQYRLTLDANPGAAKPTLAELELLATPGSSGPLTLTAAPAVTGAVGQTVTAPLATISGGRGKTSDYTATVNFQDGKGPQPVNLTGNPLGAWTVTAPHTFTASGQYPVLLTATKGKTTVSTVATASISRDTSLVGAFDNSCIGDAGTGANCDGGGWAFNRKSLTDTGFTQGRKIAVPSTDLTFDLPTPAGGNLDDSTGNGRTIHLDLGQNATTLSVIGTATQAAQHLSGTLTFSDGTTAALPIDFGDWVGAATNPISGNIVVGTSAGRLNGSGGGDNLTVAIFSTAPYTIPAGKTPLWLTLPDQNADPQSAGRLHIFAVASNGARTARTALRATPTALANQRTGSSFTATVATATGGTPPAAGAYTARINWGDGTPLANASTATATATDPATTAISGSHTYTNKGTYTVSATVDDGVSSTIATTTMTVQ